MSSAGPLSAQLRFAASDSAAELIQHSFPHVVVERVEVGAVWRPAVLVSEIWAVFTEPFQSHVHSMCRRAILLKYEVIIQKSDNPPLTLVTDYSCNN